MSRAPKVQRDVALRAAMKVFWSRGYNATTLDDLQEALGLKRGSIYSYFKSKEGLFDEALTLYHREIVVERREKVRASKSAQIGIRLFFQILVDHSCEHRGFAGCLNTNTATELSLLDQKIAERAERGFESWESFWVEIVDRAKREGDISKSRDSAVVARLLITLTQGLNVVSKVKSDKIYLDGAIGCAFDLLFEGASARRISSECSQGTK